MAAGGAAEAETEEEPRKSAAELNRAEDLKRAEASDFTRRSLGTIFPAGPTRMMDPLVIEAHVRRGIDARMFGEGDGEDPNFINLGNVNADPYDQPILERARAAWNRAHDDVALVDARTNRDWNPALFPRATFPTGVPTVAEINADPVVRRNVPTIEQATEQIEGWERRTDAKFVGKEMDGLYDVEGRVTGTSPATVAEIARNRELLLAKARGDMRDRYEAALRPRVMGTDRVGRMVELAEEGMRQGIFVLSMSKEEIPVPPTARPGTRPKMEDRLGIKATNHPRNREIAAALAEEFNAILQDPTLFRAPGGGVEVFRAALAAIPRETVSQLTEQGAEAQRLGSEAAAQAAAAREEIKRLGTTREERRARNVEARYDDMLEQRRQWYRDNPNEDRPGEPTRRLNVDDALDQALAQHSEFAASIKAIQTMPREFTARIQDIQNRAEAAGRAGDFRLRDTLRGEYDKLLEEQMKVYNDSAAEQRKRNEDIAKNPRRFEVLANVAESERRRDWLLSSAYFGNLLDTYNPQQDRFEGPPFGAGTALPGGYEIRSTYERDKITPFLKQARLARNTGRPQDLDYWMRKASEAWEEALVTWTRGVQEAETGSKEIATEAARAAAAGQEGTFFLGRTVDKQMNADMLRILQHQFGLIRQDGTVKDPSAYHDHYVDGNYKGRSLIYRPDSQSNVVVVARINEDGDTVSTEVHVTAGSALKQRRDGTYIGKPSPRLIARLDRVFQEQAGAVSNPVAADRAAGSDMSIYSNWGNAGNESPSEDYGEGYRPPVGRMWPHNIIAEGLADAGMPRFAAGMSTRRRAQRRAPGQRGLWWFEWLPNPESRGRTRAA